MSIKGKIVIFYEKYMIFISSAGHLLFLLQTLKIIEQNDTKSISIPGFCIAFISILSWLIYGFLVKNRVLIISNVVGIVFCFLTLLSIWWVSCIQS